jgi:tape measure domain-containing protein
MAGTLEYLLSLRTDRFDGPLGNSQNRLSNFNTSAGSTGGRLAGLGAAFTGGAAAVGVFAAALATARGNLESYAEFDGLVRGLKTIDGTADATAARIKELRNVAKAPGLGFEEAVRGDIRLRSVGLSADLSARSMKAFGNALATVGGGKAELDGVLLALTQIQAKGVVSAEEINQIAERAPQVRAAMAEAFGTADSQGIQKLGLSTTQFIEQLVAQLEKLPQVTSGARNALDNYDDAWKELKTTANEFFVGASSGFVGGVTSMIQQASRDITRLKNLLGIETPALGGAEGSTEAERQAQAAAEAKTAAEAAAAAESARLAQANADFWAAKEEERTAHLKDQAEQRAAAEEQATKAALARIQAAAEQAVAARLTREQNIQRQIAALQAQGPAGQEAFTGAAGDVKAQADIAERTAQILSLQKELASIQATTASQAKMKAEAAQREADAEAQTAAARAQAAAFFQQENDILAARAAGNGKLEKALQRELDIEKLKLQIMREQGLAEEDAARAARARIDLEAGAANAKDKPRGVLDVAASAAARASRGGALTNTDELSIAALDKRRGNTQGRLINPARAAEALARGSSAADPGRVRREEKAETARKAADPLYRVVKSIEEKFGNLATA